MKEIALRELVGSSILPSHSDTVKSMLEANTKVVLDESRNTKVVLDESRNSDYAKARNKGKPTQELDTVIEAWT